jgi:hypothetical protein
MLARGFVAQSGKRTVCRELTGAGLSREQLGGARRRVRLPMVSRPVAARRMATGLAAELPGRRVHVTADSADAFDELRRLPDGVTWTTRLHTNAALHGPPNLSQYALTSQTNRNRRSGAALWTKTWRLAGVAAWVWECAMPAPAQDRSAAGAAAGAVLRERKSATRMTRSTCRSTGRMPRRVSS